MNIKITIETDDASVTIAVDENGVTVVNEDDQGAEGIQEALRRAGRRIAETRTTHTDFSGLVPAEGEGVLQNGAGLVPVRKDPAALELGDFTINGTVASEDRLRSLDCHSAPAFYAAHGISARNVIPRGAVGLKPGALDDPLMGVWVALELGHTIVGPKAALRLRLFAYDDEEAQ